ncbi:hypothetical protein AK85_10190 [Streptococcus pneumoniae B1598]|nr:hypothetical protein AK85_10190 [Streptococcus pneumoniae B1598]
MVVQTSQERLRNGKIRQNLEKGNGGSRVEHLLVQLKGHSEKQDVAITVTSLTPPSAKAVLNRRVQT